MQKLIIVDLDGTLSSSQWRVEKYMKAKPKNWPAFYDNIPYDACCERVREQLLEFEKQNIKICYLSARPEKTRQNSQDWLVRNKCPEGQLLLRGDKDSRKDFLVKHDLVKNNLQNYEIVLCLDDKQTVLDMYRNLGFAVQLCVDPGLAPKFY